MSERQRFYRMPVKADPELISIAIHRIAAVMDAADDGREITFYASLKDRRARGNELIAWAQAALLIADTCEVDSVTLKQLAYAIWKGRQRELFTR